MFAGLAFEHRQSTDLTCRGTSQELFHPPRALGRVAAQLLISQPSSLRGGSVPTHPWQWKLQLLILTIIEPNPP